MICDETMFQLKPGTLKRQSMNHDQMMQHLVSTKKAVYENNGEIDYVLLLETCRDFYLNVGKRFSKEIKPKNPELNAWHEKIIAGYRDSWAVTERTLQLMTNKQNAGIDAVLNMPEISEGIRNNANIHHALRIGMKKFARPIIVDELELDAFLNGMPINSYIETTWK